MTAQDLTIGSIVRYIGLVDSHQGATGVVVEIDDLDVTVAWDAGRKLRSFGVDVSHERKTLRRNVEVLSGPASYPATAAMTVPVAHLRQRGAIEQLEDREVRGVLLRSEDPVRDYDDHSVSPDAGYDRVKLYPATLDGRPCWLESRVWIAAGNYCAAGSQDSILGLDGVELRGAAVWM